MRYLLATVAGAAALATVGLAPGLADPVHAPPVLTPAVAARVAAGCPAAAPYAAALVRGATREEAAAAAPLLAACRAEVRLPQYQWKNDAAALGLAAVELSRGLLDRDAAQLRQAAYATNALRTESGATDGQIRAWTAIPDYANAETGAVMVVGNDAAYCGDDGALNAAYINLAARTGAAWITTPRSSMTTIERRAAACAVAYTSWRQQPPVLASYNDRTPPYNPALAPDELRYHYPPDPH